MESDDGEEMTSVVKAWMPIVNGELIAPLWETHFIYSNKEMANLHWINVVPVEIRQVEEDGHQILRDRDVSGEK